MSDELTVVPDRTITVDMIREAVNLVVFTQGPTTVEAPEPPCDFPKLCGPKHCRFPRYARHGEPVGLVGKTLLQLGYPSKLLLDLDREHELGEVIHPGVKIGNSRNAALARIGPKGMDLLIWLQEQQKSGRTWGDLTMTAFGPKRLLRGRDRKRRPWRY